MEIEIKTPSYNSRRYSKPWIATVDFTDPQGNFSFGKWIGQEGTEGLLYINAEPGDIIADGQRDYRKASKSAPNYYQVRADGTLEGFSTKAEAFKAWQAEQARRAQPAPEPEVEPAAESAADNGFAGYIALGEKTIAMILAEADAIRQKYNGDVDAMSGTDSSIYQSHLAKARTLSAQMNELRKFLPGQEMK